MEVTLIDYTKDPEQAIARAAAICYGSNDDPVANAQRIENLLRLGHLSTLRHASATFLIEGVSRDCSHQLVRVAHMGILQESQRYKKVDGFFPVIPESLNDIEDNGLRTDALALLQRCHDMYLSLINAGMKKEDARGWLPGATNTRLVMTGNFQTWLHFLNLRTAQSAQWEIRSVANDIGKSLFKVAPTVFAKFK